MGENLEKRERLSIVVPCYNEEQTIPLFCQEMRKELKLISQTYPELEFEFVFVDDGSSDKTLEVIKNTVLENKEYVSFSRNFGKEAAIYAGLEKAKGDYVVTMDADLQDPPELIPELIKYWEEGYDDVYARRNTRKGETFFKKTTSKLYYKVLQSLTKVEIQKDTGDFRLLDKRCVNALKKMRETQRCSKSMFSWIGYNKKEIRYDRDPRIAGKTKWNYKKLIDLAIDGITTFTTSPLRISTYISIPTFLAFIGYFIYVIIKSIKFNVAIQAFQAIILLNLFFFATIILLIGIIGEYLGRIFNETKNRPLYFVDEYNGEKEQNEK